MLTYHVTIITNLSEGEIFVSELSKCENLFQDFADPEIIFGGDCNIDLDRDSADILIKF
jgi:hypothetical protein